MSFDVELPFDFCVLLRDCNRVGSALKSWSTKVVVPCSKDEFQLRAMGM